MVQFRTHALMAGLALGLTASACGPIKAPDNIPPVASGRAYQAQYRDPPPRSTDRMHLVSARMNAERCKPYLGAHGNGTAKGSGLVEVVLRGERLSRNDLLDIRVVDDETFTGDYVISRDGLIKLPYLDPIQAEGRSTADIERDLTRALLSDGFYDSAPRLSVRVKDFSGISVAVSGAVFEPHASEIGGAGDRIDTVRQAALGASTDARNMSDALRSVGGVRPDADLSAVRLIRGGRSYTLDMRGVFEGRHAVDVMLITGDEIVVPSRMCFQDHLMRPSPVSPPGISLFLSNLTVPATGNAPSAIGREVREVPYGTRFMQAVVDTNCVGGARASSAHRSALLLTRDPMTGVSIVIERRIEDMLRRGDRDDYDPYLLPGDAIACYDSSVTNVTEVARVLGAVGAVAVLAR
ncbi:polysaccharide biosynthesis/export family protein [Mameliella sediminis]|uniref:polysaccharide biosynthesis/export family protein n=1 Tax=Mameliella sediminis TaxID=2836866 RepID=UPI001C459B60|nr:polysaccharide biosynthesis/export family protein [Mameliella sediminis]MBY6116331.1 polysaccharide biosynthesis/export family protein [Antarctobacter heliothermus]MBY6145643.1 polysaccharide biosynthesis/export family protein [Mameliella alba]MBV7393633.1 polysaccharide biosynthesis/export family protein [Mameliella sediminis]MBY6160967.1 polysaccharide biosynthesis/export family protein [Mameliella alba]MBY6169437.1 polysaccharide biosynthesis/export family protein [Mameliella alba]